MSLVKVKNFPSRLFAEWAQQALEQEGIPSILKSPDSGILGSFSGTLPQGVDLYVPEESAETAHKILSALFNEI